MPAKSVEKTGSDGASVRAARDTRYVEIVHAAGELFAERGFDNTSLQDIGEAVGVLKGSLYHYISSKEELLYAVIQHGHEGLLENIRICKELRAGPAETLAAFAIGHITLNVHPDRYQRGIVFLRDSARLSEDKREAVIRDRDAYTDYLQQIIRDGQRRKVFCPDLDVRLTSYAILGVLNSFHRWYRPTGKSSPQDIARQFSAFILAAVSCSPPIHTPGHRTALIDTVNTELPCLTTAAIRPAVTETAEPASARSGRGELYDRIVHAAGELFAERGFDNTSLQDIGQAAGVNRGSLYHYISSKEELLYAVIQHGHEGLLENIRICKELRAGPAETLAAFAIGHITLNVHPDRYQRGIVFLRDSARLSEDKREAVIRDRDAYTDYLQQIIRDGQRRKVFCPDLDVRLTSYAILGVLNSFHRWYRPTGKSSPQDIARQFSAFILAAVSCSPPIHTPGHRTALIDTVNTELPCLTTAAIRPAVTETAEPASARSGRGELYDRIVHAAGELFAERGFDNTSLQDIGEAVGVLKGSLYHYISSKEELLYAVIQHGHEGLLENIRICKELRAGPAETLAAFAIGHITLNVHPDRYQRGIVFLRDSARLSEDKREAVIRDRDAYTDYLQQIIRDGQRRKVFCPDLDVRLTSYAILGVLNSFHRWYRPTGKSSPQDIARQFSAFILAAVSCSPPIHTPGHRTALIDTVAIAPVSSPPKRGRPSANGRAKSKASKAMPRAK